MARGNDNLSHSLPPPFSLQSEDHHIVAVRFSPTASHIGITVSHEDSGSQLEFHKLPLDSWHSQLNQYLEKLVAAKSAAEEGGESQPNVADVCLEIYGNHSTLLYALRRWCIPSQLCCVWFTLLKE